MFDGTPQIGVIRETLLSLSHAFFLKFSYDRNARFGSGANIFDHTTYVHNRDLIIPYIVYNKLFYSFCTRAAKIALGKEHPLYDRR